MKNISKIMMQSALIMAQFEAARGNVLEVLNLKKIDELRNQLVEATTKAEEVRNKSDATIDEITNIADEINNLKAAIKAQEALDEALKTEASEKAEEEPLNKEGIADIRNMFANGVKPSNAITTSTGGVVVYKELSKKIIKALRDRSDAFSFFNKTTIKGLARIPIQATSGEAVWADEESNPSPTAEPTLDILELGQNRIYKESAITQQMLNIEDLDLEQFLAEDIAEAMSDTVELAIFQGTGTKQLTGLCGNVLPDKKVNLATRGVITIDDFKKAKSKLKKSLWKKSKWFMNADTFLEVSLLKDTTGRGLMQPDPTKEADYVIENIPVEITDAMPSITTAGAATLVILATPEAYHINEQKDISLYVFRDSTFTRKGLVGYAADHYLDGKPKDKKRLAAIVNKA